MSIAVTGATGPFGRHAIESLIARGVVPTEIVAIGRRVETIADLGERGVSVRRAEYADTDALRAALAGVDRLLFVSGSGTDRIPQHLSVVTAATLAGVELIAYTSVVRADTSDHIIAQEHRATEQAILDSGRPYLFLRNGWYLENYTSNLASALDHGLFGAAGAGRFSAALRAELAEAAAAAILSAGPYDRAYELGGEAFTLTELAAEISRQSGRDVGYTNLPQQEYAELLVKVGVPEPFALVLADSDRAASTGQLYTPSADLEYLLGRPATPLAAAIRAALA